MASLEQPIMMVSLFFPRPTDPCCVNTLIQSKKKRNFRFISTRISEYWS